MNNEKSARRIRVHSTIIGILTLFLLLFAYVKYDFHEYQMGIYPDEWCGTPVGPPRTFDMYIEGAHYLDLNWLD